MNIRYRVELSQTERDELKGLLSGGRHAARKLKRAQILLAADAGASDEEIARNVGVGGSTVYRTKRRFVMGNLEAALSEEPRPGADRKLSGKEEALLVATACSSPPKGRARWTLELLVRLTEHDNISRETVRRRLEENELKPWRKDIWGALTRNSRPKSHNHCDEVLGGRGERPHPEPVLPRAPRECKQVLVKSVHMREGQTVRGALIHFELAA
jgi:transposase